VIDTIIDMHNTSRYGLTLFILLLCAGNVVAVFWYQDIQYRMPTPYPKGLVQPALYSEIYLPPTVRHRMFEGEETILHFFDPECPCSRFTIQHLDALQKNYGKYVRFIAVAQSPHGGDMADTLYTTGKYSMPIVVDSAGQIAAALGVYATPQAVILNKQGVLYFRGNYNTSRYCTNRATEFVRLALDSLLAQKPSPQFAHSTSVVVAYGCAIPFHNRP
jgi:hypothetical protein